MTQSKAQPRQASYEADVADLVAATRVAGRLAYFDMTPADARIAYRAGRDISHFAPVPLAQINDITLAGRPARLYRPHTTVDSAAAPAMLFLHGGGWVIGDLETHDTICRKLAKASHRTVIALDYRLAPEHPLPAAYDDAQSAYIAMIDKAATLRIAPHNIVVAGDSAGGALAASIALTAPTLSLPAAAAALLFYPVTDLRGNSPSYGTISNVPFTAKTMRWFLEMSLPKASAKLIARCSPLLAPSLAAFPPTFLTSCGHDPLCDEAFAFVDRLKESGVIVEHRHLPGQIHGYLTLGRLLSEGERTIAAAAKFLLSRNA